MQEVRIFHSVTFCSEAQTMCDWFETNCIEALECQYCARERERRYVNKGNSRSFKLNLANYCI